MSLLTAKNLHLNFGGPDILGNVDLILEPRERVCLVGRNGEGKSSLMRILAGKLEPDSGTLQLGEGVEVAFLPQDVPQDVRGPVLEIVLGGLGKASALLQEYTRLSDAIALDPESASMARLQRVQEQIDQLDAWDLQRRVEVELQRLDLEPSTPFEELSGGMKRQVLMVRAIVSRPRVLILDEPTNHLDTDAILWLEGFAREFQGAILFVTHDRAFLRAVANRIVDLDRGTLTSWPGNYERYLELKNAALEAESARWAREDKELAKEEVWIRQGIKARRTRNEGRVRALKRLREQRKARRERIGTARIAVHEAEGSGTRVIQCEKVAFAWEEQSILRDFSIEIRRGDRVGIIGPNGCGKTTLLKILLGELSPGSGRVKLGTNLQAIYFDQLRASIDPEKTVQQNLSEEHDQVVVDGRARHVISYLQDFLFKPDRARSPARVLSGGERNRLLLAKLFMQKANLLVMDEPTNDLDTETLELLEGLLLNFSGTLLLVSHDREFLNNVVTSCIAWDHDGRFRNYVGGYDDWLTQRPTKEISAKIETPKASVPKQEAKKRKKLGYKEQREFDALPDRIEALENEQSALHEKLSDPSLFEEGDGFASLTERLQEMEIELAALYERWDELDTLVS